MPEAALPGTDLDLISFLKAIPDAQMRRGIRIPAWYLLLVAVLGILSRCESLRDLERFAILPGVNYVGLAEKPRPTAPQSIPVVISC